MGPTELKLAPSREQLCSMGTTKTDTKPLQNKGLTKMQCIRACGTYCIQLLLMVALVFFNFLCALGKFHCLLLSMMVLCNAVRSLAEPLFVASLSVSLVNGEHFLCLQPATPGPVNLYEKHYRQLDEFLTNDHDMIRLTSMAFIDTPNAQISQPVSIQVIPNLRSYDQLFILQGPLLAHAYPIIIKAAIHTLQNVMLKHDFAAYQESVMKGLRLISFPDLILCKKHWHQLKQKECSRSWNLDLWHKQTSASLVGGGKAANLNNPRKERPKYTSSRGSKIFEGTSLNEFPCFTLEHGRLQPLHATEHIAHQTYEFQHILPQDIILETYTKVDLVCCIPVNTILHRLTKEALSSLPYASKDGRFNSISRKALIENIEQHLSNYPDHNLYSIFKFRRSKKPTRVVFPNIEENLRGIKERSYSAGTNTQEDSVSVQSQSLYAEESKLGPKLAFPPAPATEELHHRIISDYCNDMQPYNFQESGCAVCGALTLTHLALPVKDLCFDYLRDYAETTTRKERRDASDPVEPINGPVIDYNCKIVCMECAEAVKKCKLPKKALANGLWLGEVPDVLTGLTFAEQLLIAKVRINRFAVKVDSGMQKTRTNIIAFQNPIPQIYDMLPPPMSEIEETFAVMFIKSKPPSEEDFNEIPVYNVRRDKVQKALEWLKLNHKDYEGIFISYENLKQYPVNGSPVPIIMLKPEDVHTNKHPESTSVHDTEKEEGVPDGPSVAIMHGLTDIGGPVKTWIKLAGDALSHLTDGEKILVVGHTDDRESLFKNPTLYSSAFPWLFPYGLGSVENKNIMVKVSAKVHKGHLLLYHDKRFQRDRLFSLFAFNHEQIKDSTTAGFILTKQTNFQDICDRISNLDHDVLQDITQQYAKGEHVTPETAEEKNCFQLLNDLDKVAEKVDGSLTSKRHMRNELWSLVNFKGAPSWFLTFSPADNFHPLCLYYADTEEQFIPKIHTPAERYKLIAHNPVAGARFFHTMVQLFVKHVLGVNTDHPGIFGKTTAYYGTVEQQGRLTLHLHMLIWIENSLSPQEIRNRIMDPTSDFQRKMIEYLENAHMGEYIENSLDEVKEAINDREMQTGYVNPTELLPDSPPAICQCSIDSCINCKQYQDWKEDYNSTVNDILFRIHKHKCSKEGCLKNKHNACKARFPRQIFDSSMVDPLSGAICIKHKEPMLNTFNPVMPYLLRCNSDATSLLSGTAIKSTISYVTDYITKSSLNTHVIFESVKTIFQKCPELLGDIGSAANKSRQLLTKLCNSLVSKLEIGAPMASMYLLGNPDHYTSHKFVNFYWRAFVNEAMRTASVDEEIHNSIPENMVVITKGMRASSPIFDYVYRPVKYTDMTLYDWIQQYDKQKGGIQQINKVIEQDMEDKQAAFHPTEQAQDVPCLGNKRKRQLIDGEDVMLDYSSMFMEGHPQRETHQPSLLTTEEYSNRVPNFIGGSLPRRDKGDAEFYAATMLTLFKPWRSGTDLKPGSQLWSEVFDKYRFCDRYKCLMDNFNLRYECADARDDFAAQRKLMSTPQNSQANMPIDCENCDEIENQNADEEALTAVLKKHYANDEESNEHPFSVIGEKAAAKLMKMNAIESLLHRLGWTKSHCKTNSQLKLTQENTIDHSLDWSTALKDKRAEILAGRANTCTKMAIDSLEEEKAPLTGKALEYAKAFLNQIQNLVRWKDIQHLFKSYSKDQRAIVELKSTITSQFSLNKEQERAFKIITNHATSNTSARLQMYLGGMAGTGKSQVLKAVTKFFQDVGQSGQIVLLAPTGSAAALIGGSTYHSYLGLFDNNRKLSQTSMSKLRQKLQKVKNIFIDEVSMISCFDLYKISAQLSQLLDSHDEPFGGMNMIFAGDFAQLPPPGKAVSLYGRVSNSSTIVGQKAAIGKALWHQTTTVVILRQNMRQKSQTPDDARLRVALENMRYKTCTTDDIDYLHQLSSPQSIAKKLQDEQFRNVSVITAFNIHRDRINELGTNRFAADTNETLISFYSKDTWPGNAIDEGTKKQKTSGTTSRQMTKGEKEIGASLQKVLWELTPDSSQHHSGMLRLCKGLPILIKFNEATECCVTNGAEAKVIDWITYWHPQSKKRMLKTLFVELKKSSHSSKTRWAPFKCCSHFSRYQNNYM